MTSICAEVSPWRARVLVGDVAMEWCGVCDSDCLCLCVRSLEDGSRQTPETRGAVAELRATDADCGLRMDTTPHRYTPNGVGRANAGDANGDESSCRARAMPYFLLAHVIRYANAPPACRVV